ncbi:hypothetical protein HaLaN_28768, partial [Haematococcus lacustris]
MLWSGGGPTCVYSMMHPQEQAKELSDAARQQQ